MNREGDNYRTPDIEKLGRTYNKLVDHPEILKSCLGNETNKVEFDVFPNIFTGPEVYMAYSIENGKVLPFYASLDRYEHLHMCI